MMASNKKPHAPTTMTAEYWKAEALRHRREKIDLKLDIFFEETPADKEIKRAAKATSEQNSAHGKLPRPRGIDPFTTAIKAAMAGGKKRSQSFKSFMAGWEIDHINGLTAEYIGSAHGYRITDENTDLGVVTRTAGTLKTLYSTI